MALRSVRTLGSVAAFSLIACSASLNAGSRQDSRIILPDDPEAAKLFNQFGFAEAVVTPDGTIYLSGAVAELGSDGDFIAAYIGTFDYLADVLARAGASFDDVVEMTTFHTDLTSQLAPLSEVKARYIEDPFPAWTAIQVDRLYPDRGITEIKLTAKIAPPGAE
ncbi:MAG: Rid family hydrolase [Pacificimonas sp.]